MCTEPIRLFIADDHALFREGIRALLAATTDIVCVGEAATGEEAVEKIALEQPDVILMDINMPGINGIEATRRILRASGGAGGGAGGGLGIIVVTMLEDDASIFAAMRAGARGYVLKGANHQELLQVIRAVAQGQVLLGPAIAARVTQFFARVQASSSARPFPELTEREHEILELMSRHHTNTEIAQQLGIGDKTIRNHISNIFNKLQVADRAQAVVKARQAGLGDGRD
jgi:DNA-binding NarL/FixJ family response regulator